jgi:hypothetical protein
MKRNEYIWKGFHIPAEGALEWVPAEAPRRRRWFLARMLRPDPPEVGAEEGAAIEAIADLLRAAHDELVECRRRDDRKRDLLAEAAGTSPPQSNGEPPIAYVIDRIERMLGRGR